jgi:ubiquinone/menaquinone biosynthesis C-methylase UbiE
MGEKKVSVDEAYDSPPLWYDLRGLVILWLTYKSSLRLQIHFFSQMKKNGEHLEVAIGSGSLFRLVYYWSWIKRKIPRKITGFDYAPSMLAGAKKIFKNYQNIKLEVADATNLPYQENSFDTVHLANALHCIPDYVKSLEEIFRVLKPGGTFLVNLLLPPTGFLKQTANRINNWGIQKGILQGPIPEDLILKKLESIGFRFINVFRDGNCLYIKAMRPQEPPSDLRISR